MGWRYLWIYESFIKGYNEESDEGYFPEVDVQHLEKLCNLHNDVLFSSKKMKIEWKIEKLVVDFRDKTERVIHIRNLKQDFKPQSSMKKGT